MDQLADLIYTDSFFEGYATSLVRHDTFLTAELLSEFIMVVLSLDRQKVLDLCSRNEFSYYSVVVIRNLVYNKGSIFNKNHNTSNNVKLDDCIEISSEDDESDAYFDNDKAKHLLDMVYDYVEDITDDSAKGYYSKSIFKKYFEEYKSYKVMGDALNIPKSSLWYTVTKTQDKIKKKLLKEYDDIVTSSVVE